MMCEKPGLLGMTTAPPVTADAPPFMLEGYVGPLERGVISAPGLAEASPALALDGAALIAELIEEPGETITPATDTGGPPGEEPMAGPLPPGGMPGGGIMAMLGGGPGGP
jgi:hypothetical protein